MTSWRISWRNLKRKKLRSVLTIVAIVLGVAATVATISTVQTTEHTLDHYTEKMYANVDYDVLSKEGRLGAEWLDKLASVDGVSEAMGELKASFSIASLSGPSSADLTSLHKEQVKVNAIGVSDLSSNILDLEVVAGQLTAAGLVIDESTSQTWGVGVGDRVRFHDDGTDHQAEVTAIVQNNPLLINPDSWKSADVNHAWHVLLPLDMLQEWTGQGASLQRLQIRIQDNVDTDVVRERLDHVLATDEALFVQPTVADKNLVGTGLEELYAVLYVVGALSLLMSAFILYSTLYISMVERRREFAIMKAFGYTPGQVKGQILREVLLLALLGTVIGLMLGAWLSLGLTQLMFQAFRDSLTYDLQWKEAMLIATAAGIIIPLVAAWVPVSMASHIPVTSVFREGAPPGTPATSGKVTRLIVGLMLFIPGLFINHAVAFLPFFLGLALLFPGLFRCVKWLLTPLNALLFGREGHIAARNMDRHQSRTAMTAAILSFGITLLVFMSSLNLSIENGMAELTRESLGGDVWIRYSEPISSQQVNDLEQIDGVDAVTTYMADTFVWHLDDGLRQLPVKSVTEQQMEKFPLFSYDHTRQDDLPKLLREPHTLVLGNSAYEAWGGQIGEAVVLETPEGKASFKVVGVVDTMQQGSYVGFAHDDTFKQDLGLDSPDEALLLTNDDSAQAVKETMLKSELSHIAAVTTLQEHIQSNIRQLKDFFTMLHAVVGLGIVVAGIGMTNTMFMNITERIREIGTMHAVGLTRWQLQKMMLSEAFFIGGAAALIGMFTGVLMMAVTAIQDMSFMMPLSFVISWQSVFWAIFSALVISWFACLIPARRAITVKIKI